MCKLQRELSIYKHKPIGSWKLTLNSLIRCLFHLSVQTRAPILHYVLKKKKKGKKEKEEEKNEEEEEEKNEEEKKEEEEKEEEKEEKENENK